MESHWSLRRYYLHFNRKYFDGQLPLNVQVTWEPNDSSSHACTHRQRWTDGSWTFHIKMDPALKGVLDFMLILLLHEMVHVKLWDPKHGKKFQAEMHRLAEMGAFDDLW